MFNIDSSELLVVALVALLVIGPKDLPKAMRFVGHWVGKARGVARQFRSGFDTMVREAELAEMEKKWAEENARIMREHPADADAPPHVDDAPPRAEPAFHPVDAASPPPPEFTPAPVMLDKPAVSANHPQVAPAPGDTGPAADSKAAS